MSTKRMASAGLWGLALALSMGAFVPTITLVAFPLDLAWRGQFGTEPNRALIMLIVLITIVMIIRACISIWLRLKK